MICLPISTNELKIIKCVSMCPSFITCGIFVFSIKLSTNRPGAITKKVA